MKLADNFNDNIRIIYHNLNEQYIFSNILLPVQVLDNREIKRAFELFNEKELTVKMHIIIQYVRDNIQALTDIICNPESDPELVIDSSIYLHDWTTINRYLDPVNLERFVIFFHSNFKLG